jgi:hypothetical protein
MNGAKHLRHGSVYTFCLNRTGMGRFAVFFRLLAPCLSRQAWFWPACEGRARAIDLRALQSQGSEYPAVVIPVMTQHYAMLQRNLLYTGITRGKRLVVLVGQKKAVAIAVRNISGRRRWSKLAAWLGVDPSKNYVST